MVGFMGGAIPADGWLTWRCSEPEQVRLLLNGQPYNVTLSDLIDGLDRPAGTGDIAIHPAPRKGAQRAARVCLVIATPHGRREYGFPATAVGSFLADVLCPVGA